MTKKSKPVIERSVTFDNEKSHPMIQAMESEDQEDLPEITSIGIHKVPNTAYYVSFVMKSRGTTVTKILVEEPNIRQVAEESAKISFMAEFVDKDYVK